MLIATLLDITRRWHEVLPLTPAARQNLRARRELASLSPELQRDIGWPPEEYTAIEPHRKHHTNRSLAS